MLNEEEEDEDFFFFPRQQLQFLEIEVLPGCPSHPPMC